VLRKGVVIRRPIPRARRTYEKPSLHGERAAQFIGVPDIESPIGLGPSILLVPQEPVCIGLSVREEIEEIGHRKVGGKGTDQSTSHRKRGVVYTALLTFPTSDPRLVGYRLTRTYAMSPDTFSLEGG